MPESSTQTLERLAIAVQSRQTALPPAFCPCCLTGLLTAGLHAAGYLSSQSQSLLRGLLVRDPAKRLGSGPDGSKKIMDHPFFAKIDWESLKLCQVSSSYWLLCVPCPYELMLQEPLTVLPSRIAGAVPLQA